MIKSGVIFDSETIYISENLLYISDSENIEHEFKLKEIRDYVEIQETINPWSEKPFYFDSFEVVESNFKDQLDPMLKKHCFDIVWGKR